MLRPVFFFVYLIQLSESRKMRKITLPYFPSHSLEDLTFCAVDEETIRNYLANQFN